MKDYGNIDGGLKLNSLFVPFPFFDYDFHIL